MTLIVQNALDPTLLISAANGGTGVANNAAMTVTGVGTARAALAAAGF